jgi:Tol biopolymer transport system component
MPLTPGTSLGPYRILSALGAGGMGEVYRAQHIRLGREVAIKVLPESMADSPDRRSRFEREARVLGALNHPNIATLHGLEDCGDQTLLEMELVAGETLAERIRSGPLPPVEAISIFKQVAEALEAAHDQGIIHRDLKPANLKITPEGRVKVLDFGLAKALELESRSAEAAQGATFATRTHDGMIFGTAAYMSPEQVRGKPLDRRTDIWSFGCMLYEALTGGAPFEADTISDTLAAVLKEDPDWRALPAAPLGLQRLVRRCLKKDPRERLHDIGDARLDLEEALTESAALTVPLPGRGSWRISRRHAALAGLLAAATIAAIAAAWGAGRHTRPEAPRRFVVPVPAGYVLERGPEPSFVLSPDGSRVVFVALQPGGGTQLFLRPLNRFEATPIPNTQGASAPFFSSDGRWVGFHASGALHRVSTEGGPPLKIADTPAVWSAAWGADDHIVFATAIGSNGLRRVSADGGTPEELTLPKAEEGELQHAFPQLLPGGERVLFSILTKEGWQPAVLSLKTREWQALRRVTPGHTPAHFAASGHLMYAQANGGLVAVPFSPARGELTGSAIPLLERIDMRQGGSPFAISPAGTLAYLPARTELPRRALVMVDREGRATPLPAPRGPYLHPRLSRDGSRLVVGIESETGGDIWIHDIERGTRTRLTSGGLNGFPLWGPGGSQITFQATASPGRFSLFALPAHGGIPEPLLGDPPREESGALAGAMASLLPGTMPRPGTASPHVPMSWSPDGEFLAFDERKSGAQRDVWVLTRGGDPAPFVLTAFDEWSPTFSPDGHWLAYVSNETGRHEVYVQPYPGPGAKWPISTDGGTEPVWSPDGGSLFYRRGEQVVMVPVQTTPEFSAGVARVLFEGPFEVLDGARNYDVAPDGQRFVMIRRDASDVPQRFHVISNWFEELEGRTAAAR